MIKRLSELAIIGATRCKGQVEFAGHVAFALLVAGLIALNLVAIEGSATGGRMSPINAVAAAPGMP